MTTKVRFNFNTCAVRVHNIPQNYLTQNNAANIKCLTTITNELQKLKTAHCGTKRDWTILRYAEITRLLSVTFPKFITSSIYSKSILGWSFQIPWSAYTSIHWQYILPHLHTKLGKKTSTV